MGNDDKPFEVIVDDKYFASSYNLSIFVSPKFLM